VDPYDLYCLPIERITKKELFTILQTTPKFSVEEMAEAIENFYHDDEHGYNHSLAVYDRDLKISVACPILTKSTFFLPKERDRLRVWASMLHDFSRSLNAGLNDHEEKSAYLAKIMFPWTGDNLTAIIRHHDYFCQSVDHQPFPKELQTSPLAEIFRLADKTSIDPAQEVKRYYQTGERYQTPFYKPELSWDDRFSFSVAPQDKDQLCYLLLIFALQPHHFIHEELRNIYREWQKNKQVAKEEICKIAHDRNLEPESIRHIYDQLSVFERMTQ